MRTKAKKLLITTEKHEVFVMYQGTVGPVVGYCEICSAEVEMLPLDSAIKVSGISGYRLIEQIANSRVHSIETANGHLLICRNSLIESRTPEAK